MNNDEADAPATLDAGVAPSAEAAPPGPLEPDAGAELAEVTKQELRDFQRRLEADQGAAPIVAKGDAAPAGDGGGEDAQSLASRATSVAHSDVSSTISKSAQHFFAVVADPTKVNYDSAKPISSDAKMVARRRTISGSRKEPQIHVPRAAALPDAKRSSKRNAPIVGAAPPLQSVTEEPRARTPSTPKLRVPSTPRLNGGTPRLRTRGAEARTPRPQPAEAPPAEPLPAVAEPAAAADEPPAASARSNRTFAPLRTSLSAAMQADASASLPPLPHDSVRGGARSAFSRQLDAAWQSRPPPSPALGAPMQPAFAEPPPPMPHQAPEHWLPQSPSWQPAPPASPVPGQGWPSGPAPMAFRQPQASQVWQQAPPAQAWPPPAQPQSAHPQEQQYGAAAGQAAAPAAAAETEKRMRQRLLLKLQQMEGEGYELTSKYSMNDSPDDMEYEIAKQEYNAELTNESNMIADAIKCGSKLILEANKRFKLLKLDGGRVKFKDRMNAFVDKHQSQIHAVYKRRFSGGGRSDPLLMVLFGFANMVIGVHSENKQAEAEEEEDRAQGRPSRARFSPYGPPQRTTPAWELPPPQYPQYPYPPHTPAYPYPPYAPAWPQRPPWPQQHGWHPGVAQPAAGGAYAAYPYPSSYAPRATATQLPGAGAVGAPSASNAGPGEAPIRAAAPNVGAAIAPPLAAMLAPERRDPGPAAPAAPPPAAPQPDVWRAQTEEEEAAAAREAAVFEKMLRDTQNPPQRRTVPDLDGESDAAAEQEGAAVLASHLPAVPQSSLSLEAQPHADPEPDVPVADDSATSLGKARELAFGAPARQG